MIFIRFMRSGLFIFLATTTNAAYSAPESISIISDHQSQYQYKSIITSIQRNVAALDNTPSLQVLSNTEKQLIGKVLADEKTCIVSIGPQSFKKINKSKLHCSISLLIPKRLFLTASPVFQQQASVIYTNQPLQRISDVVQRTLRHVKKASILVSADWPTVMPPKHSQIDWGIQRINASDSTIEAFRLASKDSDVIIALPDSRIYNKSNIKNILLTSYKARTPLIGYSAAFSRAGALISIFTPPEYLGKQVVEWFSQGRKKTTAEAKYFKVKLNQKVAQALGTALKNESLFLQDIWTDSNE